MAWLDRARGDLRQEGLVGHVRAGIDDGDLNLVGAQAGAQGLRGAEADVAAASDEDTRWAVTAVVRAHLLHVVAGGAQCRGQGSCGGQEASSRQDSGRDGA